MTGNECYVVTFLKTVSTNRGDDREIKQRVIEVVGDDEQDALRKAKAEFCRLDRVRDWSQHADRYLVTRLAS